MDIEKIARRRWLSWAAVAVLVTVCCVLAFLQYRWIGDVADAERARLRADLQTRLNLFRQDLDGQIAAICFSYFPSPADIEKLGVDKAYLSKFRQSHGVGAEIVRRVGVAIPTRTGIDLMMPDSTASGLVNTEWPEEWESTHQHLLTILRKGPTPEDTQTSTLLEFPRFGPTDLDGDGKPDRVSEQEWLMVDLDADRIGQSLIPAMLNRYLSESGTREFDVEVVSRADPKFHIYISPGHPDVDTFPADATVSLLAIPPFAAMQTARTGQRFRVESNPEKIGGPPDQHGLWLLRVNHEAGSLEAIVAQARRRNLLLSAGLLFLILATVYALFRFSRTTQQAAEMQINFVAGVSHELRTPLTVINTAAYNLRGNVANEPHRVAKYAVLIQEESRKLSALVEQVLRYGNARAGRVVQAREPVAVAGLIERSFAAAQIVQPVHDLQLEKHIEPNMPDILVDKESMQHALQNLFENALKYGLSEDRWIGVSAATLSNGNAPSIQIRISDRGKGIPDSELENIFDPFFRGEQAVQEQIHGTGLGLNLVKKIIEAHGGKVAAHNREGRGAEFVVTVPGFIPKKESELLGGAAS